MRDFGRGRDGHQLANICASARSEDGATLKDANAAFDVKHCGLQVAVVMSSKNVAQVLWAGALLLVTWVATKA